MIPKDFKPQASGFKIAVCKHTICLLIESLIPNKSLVKWLSVIIELSVLQVYKQGRIKYRRGLFRKAHKNLSCLRGTSRMDAKSSNSVQHINFLSIKFKMFQQQEKQLKFQHQNQQIPIIQPQHQSQSNHKTQESFSDYVQEYFANLDICDSQCLDNLAQNIARSLPAYNPDLSKPKNKNSLLVHIVEFTPNYEYMLLDITYHHFAFTIAILNVNGLSDTHKITDYFHGNYSCVYRAAFDGQQIAIKSNKFREENFLEVFINTLQQYIIFKIAQQLQSGPALKNPYGFDLLIYDDSIEFAMEFCRHQLGGNNMEKQLKQSLLKLHALHIIHFDIKPENICYSPTFSKHIFIDFGLHKIVDEQVGFKTFTKFRGSLAYCYKEVVDCFVGGQHYVDAYYNDSYALIKTLNMNASLGKTEGQQQFQQQNYYYYYQLENSKLFLNIFVKFIFVNIKTISYIKQYKYLLALFSCIGEMKHLPRMPIVHCTTYLSTYASSFH